MALAFGLDETEVGILMGQLESLIQARTVTAKLGIQ